MTPRVPNLIIGGAPRSGTTYLAEALGRHPDVFMARPLVPEPKVLLGPAALAATYLERYATLFSPAPTGKLLAEKTSYYLESAAAPERIAIAAPAAKIVFLLREPVARAFSNYLRTRSQGLESLSFAEAIRAEPDRPHPFEHGDKDYVRPYDYLGRGRYDVFAERYLAACPRSQLGFFVYERLQHDSSRVLEEIQMFAGLEPRPFASLDPGIVNASSPAEPALDVRTAAGLRERCGDMVHRLHAITGLDLSWWNYRD